ncbi:hypothetical protein GGR54DRAFT_592637 [Hypoxylon sp. NC1633]|nr:hypothetical protein GGR54DRAFT_592637 [Hypoxylon sp. NC1633]
MHIIFSRCCRGFLAPGLLVKFEIWHISGTRSLLLYILSFAIHWTFVTKLRASSIAAVALFYLGALTQCLDGLAVLAGVNEVVDSCASDLSTDAASLCGSYLGTTTLFTATATGDVSGAVVTTTSLFTRTVTKVVFTTATTTETEVIVSTTSTTFTATASPGPVGRRELANDESNVTIVTCPKLSSLPTDKVSSEVISSACSCLGVNPVILSTNAATANVVTKTKRAKITTTVTSTVITYTKTTTSTTVAVATETASYDRCSVGYSSGGNGQGNNPVYVQADSSLDCCQQCQQKENCVASAYAGAMCQHLIKVSQLSGAATSDQCPLGIENYAFGDAGDVVYPGPCGY